MDHYGDQNLKTKLPNLLSKHIDASVSALLNVIFHAIYLWSFGQFPLIHWKYCSFYLSVA